MIQYVEEAHGVFAIPLLDKPACKSIVDYVRSLDHWENAEVREELTEGAYDSITMPDVRSASIWVSACEPEVYREFDEKMTSIVKPLVKEVWQVALSEHSGTQLIRYQPGGYYQGHPDAAGDLAYRYFSVVCYLNDDFEGGKTWFPSLNYSATPECGKAILFPARYFHCAQPVIAGENYVLV
jgi:hypothetical protein